MNLRNLPPSLDLKEKRVLVRVDWNIPLRKPLVADEALKIERSIATLRNLVKRGAIVIVMTHLGRPKKPSAEWSTEQLIPVVHKMVSVPILFHPERLSQEASFEALVASLSGVKAGSIHLLENVRFNLGEEKNAIILSKRYAQLADIFINDAFASSHRAHASVVGVARQLPSYAGATLIEEVTQASRLLDKVKHPFVAIVGGMKVSTKLPLLQTLLKTCDRVCTGGAMASTLLGSIGLSTGASFVEKDMFAKAKGLLKYTGLCLPIDVCVVEDVSKPQTRRIVKVEEIRKRDIVVDVGPRTLQSWVQATKGAKTILWNGPVGMSEISEFGFGSRFIARLLAQATSKHGAYSIAGGGDTIPLTFETKTFKQMSFVSTGGGALLEFIAKKGKLPGVVPLIKQ